MDTTQSLISFFESVNLPKKHIKISSCETITDLKKFVDSHVLILKNDASKSDCTQFAIRLQKLKNILENE